MAKIHFRNSFAFISKLFSVNKWQWPFLKNMSVVYLHVLINIYTWIAFREFFVMFCIFIADSSMFIAQIHSFSLSLSSANRLNPYSWTDVFVHCCYWFFSLIRRLCVKRIMHTREIQREKKYDKNTGNSIFTWKFIKWSEMEINQSDDTKRVEIEWTRTKRQKNTEIGRERERERDSEYEVNKNGREWILLTYAMEKQTQRTKKNNM